MTAEGFYIREDAITQNIQYLLEEVNSAPILVFFGSGHTLKTRGYISMNVPEFKSWAQRLSESGVEIYSVSIWALSGDTDWRGVEHEVVLHPDRMSFDDGTTLSMLFDSVPDYAVIYIDLRLDATRSFRFGNPYEDIPAGEMYDGIIVFRKVNPMKDACPR